MDPAKIEIKSQGSKAHIFEDAHNGVAVKQWIQDDLKRAINDIKVAVFDEGKKEFLFRLPAFDVLPAFALYYLAYLAESVNFSDEYVDYGFFPFGGDKRILKVKSELGGYLSEFEKPS